LEFIVQSKDVLIKTKRLYLHVDLIFILLSCGRIGCVMVGVLASRAVDSRNEPKNICCFSDKHAALRSRNKDWLARNQNNVSKIELRVYARTVVSVSYDYENLTKGVGSSTKRTSLSFHWKLTCSRHDIAEKLLSWS
jgi:hypothetical protein